MDTFIELDINPAKVVALYPESVAGRLSMPQEEWISLFGGPAKPDNVSAADLREDKQEGSTIPQSESTLPSRVLSPVGSIKEIRGKLRTGLEAIRPSIMKDDDTASISSKRKAPVKGVFAIYRSSTYEHGLIERTDDFTRSVETLLRYLSDRRPKVGGALATFHITPAQSHQIEPLSKASVDDIFNLPNTSLSALTPDQLLRYAQIVDTALFKSYLIVRPGLIGALCRVENWCEVSEVEEVLRSREACHLSLPDASTDPNSRNMQN
jgi:Vam6/Vps39-like protein vacuolar protein sorting-associated protein 39